MLTCAILVLLAQSQAPAARTGVGAARVGGTAYVVGGAIERTGTIVADLLAYEINAGRWTTKTRMPEPIAFPAVAAAGGKLYVFGGLHEDGSSCGHARQYDPAIDKWSSLPSMPTARSRATATLMLGKIVVIGGIDGSDQDPANSNRVETFDTGTRLWGRLDPIKNPRHGHVAEFVRDRLVVAGGYGNDAQTASVEVYEAGNGWSAGPSLPESRGFAQSVAYGGAMWVFGNRGGALHPVKFDPAESKWTASKADGVTRHRGAAVELGGRAYFFFGEETDDKPVAVFDLVRDAWSR